ncbi:hypothetical protein D3C72_1365220 [compost metagenome]
MAINFDAQRIAHPAAGAVGTDHQPRQQHALAAVIGHPHLAVTINHITQTEETHRTVAAQPWQLLQPAFQRLAEITRHHHLAEPRPVVICCIELHAAEITGAADMDAADRAGRHRQLLHDPQRGQRVDGGCGKTEVALVEHRWQFAGRAGFEQSHVAAQPVQGDGQAGTHQTATDDQHVMSFTHGRMIRARRACMPGPACAKRRAGLE